MALRRDSIEGVQAVQTEVNHPDEISTIFDGAIVYAKGARLLRMLQHHVGDAAFQAGLKQYFKDHAYGNTEGDDLWNAIAAASGEDIAYLMNTWISQPGFPVVQLKREGDDLLISQQQFFTSPHQPSDRLWPIPLNATSADLPPIFDQAEARLSIPPGDPIRLNVADSAHFITAYDAELMEDIVAQLEAGNLGVVDRTQLLNETSLLARGGVISSARLIDLASAFRQETREPVWGMVSMLLGELRKFVVDTPDAKLALKQLSGSIAADQYERLGWTASDEDSDEDRKLRSTILGLTLYSEESAAIAEALKQFAARPLAELDAELRPLLISTTARHGNPEVIDELLTEYRATSSSDLQQDIIYGITSVRRPEQIKQLLAAITDGETVRPQDAARWFVYLMRSDEARALTWSWLTENWQWIITTFSGDKSYDDFPRYAAGALSTQDELAAYRSFFEPMQSTPALGRVVTMGLSEIQGRVTLIERDRDAVCAQLLGH